MGELNLRGSMLPGSRRRRLPSPTATDIFRFVSMMSEIGFAPPPHIMTPRRRLADVPPETPGPSRQRPGAVNTNPRSRTTTAAPPVPPAFSVDRILRMLRSLRNAQDNASQPNIHPRPSRSVTTTGRHAEHVTGSTRASGTISTRQAAGPNCTITSHDQRSSVSAPRSRAKTILPLRRNVSTNTTNDLQSNHTIKNAQTQTLQSNRTIKNARAHKKSEGELRPCGNLAQPARDDGSMINLVVLKDCRAPEGLDVAGSSSATPVAHPSTQINVTPIESHEINCAQNTPMIATSSGAILVSDIDSATTTFNEEGADNLRYAIPDTLPEPRAVSMLIDWDAPTPTIHQLDC